MIIVRYGGDEFIIILLDTELQEAESILPLLKKALLNSRAKTCVSIAYGIEQVSSYDDISMPSRRLIENVHFKGQIQTDVIKKFKLKSVNILLKKLAYSRVL